MCGRYQIRVPFSRLIEVYGFSSDASTESSTLLPALNVGPTHPVPVIVAGETRVRLRIMRWGFPSAWVARDGKDPWQGRPLINARAEEALGKRTWAEPLRQRRCILPCTGFYEWLTRGKRKLPVWFEPSRTDVLSMAGIWSEFERDGQAQACVSVLTIAANPRVAPVHDRMPVFVPVSLRERWLGPLDSAGVEAFLRPAPEGILSPRAVATRLGRMSEQDIGVLEADWDLESEGVLASQEK